MSVGKKVEGAQRRIQDKVGSEAVLGVRTVTEIAQDYGVHPVLVVSRRKRFWRTLTPCLTSSADRSRWMKATQRTSCTARSSG